MGPFEIAISRFEESSPQPPHDGTFTRRGLFRAALALSVCSLLTGDRERIPEPMRFTVTIIPNTALPEIPLKDMPVADHLRRLFDGDKTLSEDEVINIIKKTFPQVFSPIMTSLQKRRRLASLLLPHGIQLVPSDPLSTNEEVVRLIPVKPFAKATAQWGEHHRYPFYVVTGDLKMDGLCVNKEIIIVNPQTSAVLQKINAKMNADLQKRFPNGCYRDIPPPTEDRGIQDCILHEAVHLMLMNLYPEWTDRSKETFPKEYFFTASSDKGFREKIGNSHVHEAVAISLSLASIEANPFDTAVQSIAFAMTDDIYPLYSQLLWNYVETKGIGKKPNPASNEAIYCEWLRMYSEHGPQFFVQANIVIFHALWKILTEP